VPEHVAREAQGRGHADVDALAPHLLLGEDALRLAREIVGAESRPREKARLLYEWVSTNITYGGNCIGVGAVVPRDVDVVLDNRMGDCKDHATLLQALLAAQGIRSEQVLINSDEQYDLAKTPVVSMVNHVLNYLPEFDLYVDATAKEIPFGYMPEGSHGKPVIHVGRSQAIAKVPLEPHEATEQRVRMALKLDPNGGASGTLSVALRGRDAASLRAFMRTLDATAERDLVKDILGRYGLRGRGTANKGDTKGLSDRYEFSMQFEVERYLPRGQTGIFPLSPLIATPHAIERLADVDTREPHMRNTRCTGFHSYETLEFELPPGLTLVELPQDLQVRQPMVDYTASYKLQGQRLVVQREVHDKMATGLCAAQAANEFDKQAMPIAENLQHKVLFRRRLHD